MRAVQRLRGLGWLLSCVVVVLGFYMTSLSVASERNKLDAVNARIARAHRDLRQLETEFQTRANLAQLERWNGEVLALTAPAAGQFVDGEAQFASLNRAGPASVDIQTAQLIVPTAPHIAPVAAPRVVEVRTAAVATEAVVHEAPAVQQAVAAVRTVATTRKAQAVAMLDRQLLSDSTLGDLLSGARAETTRLR